MVSGPDQLTKKGQATLTVQGSCPSLPASGTCSDKKCTNRTHGQAAPESLIEYALFRSESPSPFLSLFSTSCAWSLSSQTDNPDYSRITETFRGPQTSGTQLKTVENTSVSPNSVAKFFL